MDRALTSQINSRTAAAERPFTQLWCALLIITLVSVSGLSAHAQQAGTMTPEQLVPPLQKGGLILYIRHAATDHFQSDTDLSDFANCDLQRNLSEQGKRESTVMASAIRSLQIPVGEVLSSPYCRCVDTARIVFGKYEVHDDMQATFYTDKAQTRKLADFLRIQLSTIPVTKSNTVLVGHTANLREVTGVWPKPEGVAHVFEPLGAGNYRHLGRILPTEWPSLAERMQ